MSGEPNRTLSGDVTMQDRMPDTDLLSRRQMVEEQVRSRGIDDPRILAAMEQVPRERFVPLENRDQALEDRALPIACGQTISQPYMVACMSAHLELEPHHRVLEIGTGSGYQTAVLARLAGEVYTVERVEPLLTAARSLLESMGVGNVLYRLGDGSLGWPESAPFDRIIVTAAAPRVPQALLKQLVDPGLLVIPVGGESEQTLTVVRLKDGRLIESPRLQCRFVKLIGDQAWSEGVRHSPED
jgi:protein-L-isoaspartate(D-aspartate) O-methyltransferase